MCVFLVDLRVWVWFGVLGVRAHFERRSILKASHNDWHCVHVDSLLNKQTNRFFWRIVAAKALNSKP